MEFEQLAFPENLHYAVEDDTWARAEDDGTFIVGITALGIALSGEIYMCRPKPVGAAVEQGRGIAVAELAKAIVSVKSPLSGEVLAVNEELAQRPELVHRDPYGGGWIARLRALRWDEDRERLVTGAAVRPAMRQHALRMKDESGGHG